MEVSITEASDITSKVHMKPGFSSTTFGGDNNNTGNLEDVVEGFNYISSESTTLVHLETTKEVRQDEELDSIPTNIGIKRKLPNFSAPSSCSHSVKECKAFIALQNAHKMASESTNEDDDNNAMKRAHVERRQSNIRHIVAGAFTTQKEYISLSGLRVLLCEDSIPSQKMMTKWLQKHGCIVTVASNGKDGLEYMTTEEFDVCMMDFLMVSIIAIMFVRLCKLL